MEALWCCREQEVCWRIYTNTGEALDAVGDGGDV